MVNQPDGDLLYGVVQKNPAYPERLTYQLLNEIADELESKMTTEQIGTIN